MSPSVFCVAIGCGAAFVLAILIDRSDFLQRGLLPVGNFLAALAYHGPTQRLSTNTLVEHLDTMREGAAKLAALMK